MLKTRLSGDGSGEAGDWMVWVRLRIPLGGLRNVPRANESQRRPASYAPAVVAALENFQLRGASCACFSPPFLLEWYGSLEPFPLGPPHPH